MSVADTTNPGDGSSPGYGDQVSLTATVSPSTTGVAIPALDENNNAETVEFYDTVTGQYLGQADLNPTGNPSGSATATWYGTAENMESTAGYNLGIGSYSIIAVYNGDSNFNGSQSSSTAMNVNGDGLSLGNSLSVGWGTINEGTTATLSGTVSGLNGAAFSVTVNWGDGTSSDSDNNSQPFYFAAGADLIQCEPLLWQLRQLHDQQHHGDRQRRPATEPLHGRRHRPAADRECGGADRVP